VYRIGGASVAKLLRCGRCHTSQYCSAACQKSSWKQFHSFECKQLWSNAPVRRTFAQLAPDAQLDLLLLSRCVRRRMREEEGGPSGDALRAQTQEDDELERSGAPLASGLEEVRRMESHYEFVQRCVDQHRPKKPKADSKKPPTQQQQGDGAAAPAPTAESDSNGAVDDASSSADDLSEESVLGMAQRLSDNTQLLSFGFRLGLFGPSVTPSHVQSLLLPLLFAFQSNNFAISNALLLTEGAGVYPLGALLNHSCAPNCAIVYEQRAPKERRDRRAQEWLQGSAEQVLADPLAPASSSSPVYPGSNAYVHVQTIRTLRAVKAGEELCHSYIDTASVTSKRREQLASRYYFLCQCARCSTEGSAAHPPPAALEHFLERDIDGNQLPEYLLAYATEAPKKPLTQGDEAIPASRRAALLRANRLWHEATALHMVPNTATTPEAFEKEESRRCAQEQSLIAQALSIRLQHLHPYAVPLMASYSKLLHACLLTNDQVTAIHACEQLCAKYRVVYGAEQIRQQALQRVDRRRKGDQDEADEGESDVEPAHVAAHASMTPHALLGLQLYTLGALYAAQKDGEWSLASFAAARTILLVTHGATHSLVRKLDEEMEQARTIRPTVALD
jgi:hypothetical protein